MRRRFLLYAAFGVPLLALVVFAVMRSWNALSAGMSPHGWIAYGIGAFFTLALSMGLFAISFHSSRNGHDEAADSEARRHADPQDRP